VPSELNRPLTIGMPVATAMTWTPEARERLERVPSFVRGVITQRLEAYARDRHEEFVLHAERLDGDLWAVLVNAL
jgi:hypothetical protein